MATCPRCGRAAAEGASFCSACGTRLPGDVPRATRARKTVTVLFADVSGFTSLSERLDPESLQQLMTRYFEAMRRIIGRHGGKVEKLIGDAIMAVFGVPVVHEDDALRAARAALEMNDALDELNEDLAERWDVRLQTHTGVNTGVVIVGAGGHGDDFTYGDTVNVAQRLEDAAAPGEILVGSVTARLLDGVAELSSIPPLRLKGKAEPVRAWRLAAVDPDAHRANGSLSALVGRRAECAMLRGAFDEVVRERQPRLVTILGPAGIGKSRLARALIDAIGNRAEVVAGRCLPYGEGITYWPLAEIVRRLAGRAEERAIADAAGATPEADMIAERIVRVIGTATGGVAIEEGHWAARRLFEIRAAKRPLVVIVDDLHWGEPTLIDLLEHVATFAGDVPLLLVSLARPELLDRRPTWTGTGERHTVIELGPLGADDAAALLGHLTTGAEVDPDDAARLLATAEGNPFFLEQIVAMRDEPGGETAETPASIHALLAARIDALPPAERAVIDRAAVEGRGFHRSALAELLHPADRASLDASLEALARRRLVSPGRGELPGEAGYHFSHILVRDVAYDLLPKSERADLHERYADWLDRRAGPRYAELVGYHYEQAHRWHAELRPRAAAERRGLADAAAGRLSAAGRAALERGDLPGGINLLERTTALFDADDEQRGRVLPELGLALVQSGQLSRAEAVLVEATRVAANREETLGEAHARVAQFFALVQVDPEAATHELSVRFDTLRHTFTAAADDLGLARLWRAQALVHWLPGHSQRAAAAWERSIRYAVRAGDEQSRADALAWLASAAMLGPMPVPRAITRCEAILRDLSADRRSQGLTMRPLAALHAMAGRFDTAHELFAKVAAIEADLGVGMHAAAPQDEAIVHLLAGDPAAAEAVLRVGYEHLREMGERALLSTVAGMLARALLEQDRDAEAEAVAEVCAEAAAPDDISACVLHRMVRGELRARKGALDEAEQLSAEAVELAEQTDWLMDRADALMARGRVLRATGDRDRAHAALYKAFELYTRKGNVVSAARARQAVDAVPPSPARHAQRRTSHIEPAPHR
jgi:class 3 adenylate cyclase/tetratricopeptide (TPR) repeat protein